MEDYESAERLITYYLWAIIPPILITLGTIGNSLSIAVLTRKVMRTSSASVYLIALALADITVLLTGLLRHFVHHVTGYDVRHYSDLSCKLNVFLVYVSLHTSVWILVAFTIERVLSVFTPHKVKRYCTRVRAGLVTVSIVVIIMALNGHIIYGSKCSKLEFSRNSTSTQSTYDYSSKEYYDFFVNVWPWIDYSVYSLFPFIILITGNTCIAVRVLMRQRMTRKIAAEEVTPYCMNLQVATITHKLEGEAAGLSRPGRNYSMTVVLFLLNLVFLTTTAPMGLFEIIKPSWNETTSSRKDSDITNLTYAVVSLVMYMNNSINFILYCLTGSRFKKELFIIFRKFSKLIHSGMTRSGQIVRPFKHFQVESALQFPNKCQTQVRTTRLSQ